MKAYSSRPARVPQAFLAFALLVSSSAVAGAQPEAEAGEAPAAEQEPTEDEGGEKNEEAADAEEPGAAEEDAASADAEQADAEAEGEASAGLEAALGGEAKAEGEAKGDASGAAKPETVATPAVAAEPPDPDYAFGVQRLPASAYPEPVIRGIPGGSLWFTMHGHQWPYMPQRGSKPGVMLGFSGSGWVDPSYVQKKSGDPNQADVTEWRMDSRFVLRATPTYSRGDWFVQGQGELVANNDQSSTRANRTVDTDDLWVRIGQWNTWDVQLGRYEAWELYHFGMGLDLNTFERQGATVDTVPAPQIYGVTYGFYRSTVGNVGFHVYPLDFLRFEVLGQAGVGDILTTAGGRGAAVLDLGWLKFKAGGEYRKEVEKRQGLPQEYERRGSGASLQFVFAPYVEFGASGAYGLTDHIDFNGNTDFEGSFTTYSYGGFANVGIIENLVFGVGAHYTWLEDIQREPDTGRVGEFDHLQTFAALQYAFFGQFYLKLVGSYAKARLAPTFTQTPPFDNSMVSGRLRASVYF